MKSKLQKLIEDISNNFRSKNDPFGGYTGNSKDGEKPSQDADDL